VDSGPGVEDGGMTTVDAGADDGGTATADSGAMCTPAGSDGCAGAGALPCCTGMCCAGVPLPENGRCLETVTCPIEE
jgi:hypothetical protein